MARDVVKVGQSITIVCMLEKSKGRWKNAGMCFDGFVFIKRMVTVCCC